MHEHLLTGCRPEPMASYLKALGIFRILSDQRDPTARGCWREGVFALSTVLTREELIDFFVSEYRPTPVVSPWLGGSGFYPGDKTEALEAILASADPRFEAYRRVITAVQSWPELPRSFATVRELLAAFDHVVDSQRPGKKRSEAEELQAQARRVLVDAGARGIDGVESMWLDDVTGIPAPDGKAGKDVVKALKRILKKVQTKCSQDGRGKAKEQLLPLARSRLPEGSLSWLDAAYVVKGDGRDFNPILGTGGNEGKLEFSNNFMQRLVDLLANDRRDAARGLFHVAVFGGSATGLWDAKIGQYDPGRSGGYNQGAGIEHKDFKINPWDFVLLIEGAQTMAGSASKRGTADHRSLSTVPFTVHLSNAGFSSSAAQDSGRAEVWLPIWTGPSIFAEIRQVFAEGRADVGGRAARDGIGFARAAGTLGIDRGIRSFVRYTLLKRRGDSYVALPAGRVPVREVPELHLLEELDPILGRLDGFMRRFPNVPAAFASARRAIDDALFACTEAPDAAHFAKLLRCLGRIEELVAQRDRQKKPKLNTPLGGLSPAWIAVCDADGTEVRLAAALASIIAAGKVGPIRANLAGVDPARPWVWVQGRGQTSWHGGNLVDRLVGVLAQRLMDAERLSAPHVPTAGAVAVEAADVVPFLLGETDDEMIEELLWGLTWVDWRRRGRRELAARWASPIGGGVVPRPFALLRLLFSPYPVRDRTLPLEPRVLPLLQAGRMEEACAVAVRRFRTSDLVPFEVNYRSSLDARRLAASLLIPVRTGPALENLVLKAAKEPR